MSFDPGSRALSWNQAMTASPGDVDLHIAASEIVGSIPEPLRGGRLLSNGPGWTLIGGRLAHPFDGHGYLRCHEFGADGSVRVRARFVRTRVFVDEAREQRLIHRGLATNPADSFWKNLRIGAPRNVSNTTVYPWGGRLLTGWEAGSPHALDPATLDTLGVHTFGGLIEGQVTLAHMHRDAARGRLILCSVAAGRSTRFTLREVDREDRLVQQRTGESPGLTFAHDFAFTDSWYVLGGNPLALKPLELTKALLGASTMLRSVRTDLRRPGELVLIPRDVDGPTRRVRLPRPAYVVHFANAFERGGELIVDACIFHDFPFGEEFGYTGPNSPLDPTLPDARGAQTLYRIRVPAGASEATWEPLVPHGVDFPRVHPELEGRQAPMMVGACRRDPRYSDPFDSLIRIDLLDLARPPSLWTASEDVFVGEPVVAPGADGQDYVLALLSDGLRRATTLAVFEAAALERGPVARVSMPLMPVAFHGDWEGRGSLG
jgi:all-trans-8'-apo-beta-carotenal 15,15'-oxygenase